MFARVIPFVRPTVITLSAMAVISAHALPAAAYADDSLPKHAVARIPSDPDARNGDRSKGGRDADRALPGVRQVVFSPDGKLLATRGEPADPAQPRLIHLWDAATGRLVRTLEGRDSPLTDLEFSPDGKRLVAAYSEDARGVQVWDLAAGRELLSFDGGRGEIHFLPGGGRIAVIAQAGANDVVRVHEPATGKEVQRFVVRVSYRLAFSPDGKRLLSLPRSSGTAVHAYDISSGEPLARLEGSQGPPVELAFSPDSRTVAAAGSARSPGEGYSHEVIVWELATESEVFRISIHTGRVLAVAFSPDARCLATAGVDRTVRLWEVATGKEIGEFRGHNGPVASLAFSADGRRLASGGLDRTVIVWDVASLARSFLPDAPLDEKTLDVLWEQLAAPDPAQAYPAIGRLAAGGEAAAEYLQKRIAGLIDPSEDRRVGELLARLEHPDSEVRHRAMMELRKIRRSARPLLLAALRESDSTEVRQRLRLALLGSGDAPRFTAADVRRLLRVVHAAEWTGGAEAAAILRLLSRKLPAERVAREARDALERLDRR